MWCDGGNNIHAYSNAPSDTLCKPANYHCEHGAFVPNANILNLSDYYYDPSADDYYKDYYYGSYDSPDDYSDAGDDPDDYKYGDKDYSDAGDAPDDD